MAKCSTVWKAFQPGARKILVVARWAEGSRFNSLEVGWKLHRHQVNVQVFGRWVTHKLPGRRERAQVVRCGSTVERVLARHASSLKSSNAGLARFGVAECNPRTTYGGSRSGVISQPAGHDAARLYGHPTLPGHHVVSGVPEPMHALRHHLRWQPTGPSHKQTIQTTYGSSKAP